MPTPFVHDSNDPRCYCGACSAAAEPGTASKVLACVLALVVICVLVSSARGAGVVAPEPIPAPSPLLHARAACPNTATALQCRAALVRAYAALRWQRNERIAALSNPRGYGVDHAIRLAAALYQIPLRDFNHVIACESGHDPNIVNGRRIVRNKRTTPLAVGLMQWLLSSWHRQGLPGFDRTDPYAAALAAGRAVKRDHGWGQWVCKP